MKQQQHPTADNNTTTTVSLEHATCHQIRSDMSNLTMLDCHTHKLIE